MKTTLLTFTMTASLPGAGAARAQAPAPAPAQPAAAAPAAAAPVAITDVDLKAIAGPKAEDRAKGDPGSDGIERGSAARAQRGPYTNYLKRNALQGRRFGVPAFILKTAAPGIPSRTLLLTPDAREFYRLEQLWGEAPSREVG